MFWSWPHLDIVHSLPLVDEERLVAVHEPGEILQPLQPDWDGAVLEEQTAEQHERDEDGGTNCQCDVDIRGSTGDHITYNQQSKYEFRFDGSV